MTVPIIFFPGLSLEEYAWFTIIQSALSLLLMVGFSWVVSRSFKEDKNALNLRTITITALLIEGGNILTSISWVILVLFVLAGFLFLAFLYALVPYFIIHLTLHEQEDIKVKTRNVLFLYLFCFIPSFLVSMSLTSVIFNLFGVKNHFLFTFWG